MGLPVLLVPVAPSGLQKAPEVTPALGAGAFTGGAGTECGAGTGLGSSRAGAEATVEGIGGTSGWIDSTTDVVGSGVTGIGESADSGLVAGTDVTAGFELVAVTGAALCSVFVRETGSTESFFGATTPIKMNSKNDAANTHPAVLRLRMRAQCRRPRTRAMTAMTTVPIHTRTRMDATACINDVPGC
ncbi:hypothetical protein ACIA8C_12525 [Nocardia sp. NPDC051321]|uniref:hypothetical protein n=1 Tax=Nocardia sp. NPDC051321 TaxID=3364323 RepID=UPI00379B04C6